MTGVPPGIAAHIPFQQAPLYDAGVTIGLQTEDRLTEAEIRTAASRRSLRDDGMVPRFDIGDVISTQPEFVDSGEWLTLVGVDTSLDMLKLSDVKLLHGEIGNRYPKYTDIQPSLDRAAQAGSMPVKNDDVVPKVIARIEADRGTESEFRDYLDGVVGPLDMGEVVLDVDKPDGNWVAIIAGLGGSLRDWMDLGREGLGPGNKSVTTIRFGGVAVSKAEYEPYREDNDNGGYVDRSDLPG